MAANKFDNLFLLARPAAGKSELIDFMKKVSAKERFQNFHIGEFEEVDDFPWLWEACCKDDEREKRGDKRLYSERAPGGHNVTKKGFRGSLIPKLNIQILEKFEKKVGFYKENTLLIEFARGIGDGFADSLKQFSPKILKHSAILYLNVSLEESVRKNNARYKEGQEGSILCHKVPDADMTGFFKENDWNSITKGAKAGSIDIAGVNVPFVTMDNEPELKEVSALSQRYGSALGELFQLYSQGR